MPGPQLDLYLGFLDNATELFNFLSEQVEWDERMKARKTASFGVAYNYSNMTYPQAEMLPALIPVCERIARQVGFLPNNCLLNYYPDGQSTMGYHSDSTAEMQAGTGVVILSLGSTRFISFRNKQDPELKFSYALNHGDLLYMKREIQDEWQHAIPKDPAAGARISLTFRSITG
ncbi:alpha-ketoglutarate-dependent dioxygenase AlkB family protein [Gimesia panareensis]|uniref:2OG-Fe(II) oxygenase superfamily protein n=1 Tax=Gimesia panareensis TaxID=2527978 RepID=A0A517QGH6_9PLAN|nr:alpha-ketoglutarate-dependent dioxygenase AlkB [Gimesia panareensis]QDT30731.1 2OG-Fe(II) oxygenase superfamily protein [Gimesia panareensis]QDU53780.1 2OG-Fe(II) oxygenase superfamily protein [Gimesia panareensis]QDV21680.1 2OG-Fe(II) oxygenase superfamily protein [Gimesia panareensis]